MSVDEVGECSLGFPHVEPSTGTSPATFVAVSYGKVSSEGHKNLEASDAQRAFDLHDLAADLTAVLGRSMKSPDHWAIRPAKDIRQAPRGASAQLAFALAVCCGNGASLRATFAAFSRIWATGRVDGTYLRPVSPKREFVRKLDAFLESTDRDNSIFVCPKSAVARLSRTDRAKRSSLRIATLSEVLLREHPDNELAGRVLAVEQDELASLLKCIFVDFGDPLTRPIPPRRFVRWPVVSLAGVLAMSIAFIVWMNWPSRPPQLTPNLRAREVRIDVRWMSRPREGLWRAELSVRDGSVPRDGLLVAVAHDPGDPADAWRYGGLFVLPAAASDPISAQFIPANALADEVMNLRDLHFLPASSEAARRHGLPLVDWVFAPGGECLVLNAQVPDLQLFSGYVVTPDGSLSFLGRFVADAPAGVGANLTPVECLGAESPNAPPLSIIVVQGESWQSFAEGRADRARFDIEECRRRAAARPRCSQWEATWSNLLVGVSDRPSE